MRGKGLETKDPGSRTVFRELAKHKGSLAPVKGQRKPGVKLPTPELCSLLKELGHSVKSIKKNHSFIHLVIESFIHTSY